jgi:acetyltransferase-like isoleucine patch superfamily enzyme
MDIFERMRNGELIKNEDLGYNLIAEAIEKAFEITGLLNSAYHNDEQVRTILSELMGFEIDPSTTVKLPFHTDFGQFTRFGKNVFVNFGCSFMDRGGITIEDNALIGPNIQLITENHAMEPELRRYVYGNRYKEKRVAGCGSYHITRSNRWRKRHCRSRSRRYH